MNKGEGGDKRWIFKQTRPRPKKGAPKDTHLLVHISEPAQCTIATHIYLEFRSSDCKTQFHATGEGCLFFADLCYSVLLGRIQNPQSRNPSVSPGPQLAQQLKTSFRPNISFNSLITYFRIVINECCGSQS